MRKDKILMGASDAAIDPRKLLYFAEVVEDGSFKKAAIRLSLTQPALSISIDRLEQSIGDRLLERSSTGVTLTPLGEVVYAHARLVREELLLVKHRVTEEQHGDDVIRLGTLPSLVPSIIPKAVCAWRKDHKATLLRVVEKTQLQLVSSLARGELDFIVVQTEYYGFEEGIRQRVLFRDRLHILARPGHPVHDLAPPTWKDLAGFPWVIAMVGRQRVLLEDLLASEGEAMPQELTECASPAAMKAIVAGSDSLAMLPASALGSDVVNGQIVPVQIEEERLNRDIAVLFRAGSKLSHASQGLLKHIQVVGLSLADEGFKAQAGRAAR